MINHFYSNLSEKDVQFYEVWNGATDNSTSHHLITDLFSVRSERYFDLAAAEHGDELITYGELERNSNQFARLLKAKHGIKAEDRIGLFLRPSLNLPIALLSVLKSSAAFVPLDPNYPADRLMFMITDANLSVILTTSDLMSRLPCVECSVLAVDTLGFEAEKYSTDRIEEELLRSSLAYVIYTSGSTGHPKGVMVEHKGIANMAIGEANSYRIGLGDRVLQYASINFDASVCEFFMAWVSGATVCLIDNEDRTAGQTLNNLLREKKINAAVLTPTVLAVTSSDNLPDLRTIGSAGESCFPSLIEKWGNGRHFVNAFGPTENTVVATAAAKEDCYPSITIGKPIPNVRVYTLNKDNQQVGVGQIGEIAMAGIQVARGYHNQPELTAERFVKDPEGESASAKLYKSGDFGRITARGNLEYLGRRDDQIKLRGMRIELGEIEAAINSFANVSQSSVLLVKTPSGDQRLVAYFCGDITAGELRANLAELLPPHMIPAYFERLTSLPITPNGKVDKKLLEKNVLTKKSVPSGPVPETFVEIELAKLWIKLLETDAISTSDNFFELGGYSLLAMQLTECIIDQLGVRPDIKLLTLGTFKEVAKNCEVLIKQREKSWLYRLRKCLRLA